MTWQYLLSQGNYFLKGLCFLKESLPAIQFFEFPRASDPKSTEDSAKILHIQHYARSIHE